MTEILKKKSAANISTIDHLRACQKAILSLREWSGVQGHILEKHLLDLLANTFSALFLSTNINNTIIDSTFELEKKLQSIEKHINVSYSINFFFKSLKKLNEGELHDPWLRQLLNSLDDNRGLVVLAEEFPREILRLSKAVYSYLDKKLISITVNSDIDQIKKKKFFLDVAAALKPFQHINPEEAIFFEKLDINKINNLLENYESRESFVEAINVLVLDIQVCVKNKAWKNKTKNSFGPPHGIRQLRKIFNNQKLLPFEKLLIAHKFLEKKLKLTTTRDIFTSFFYNDLFLKLNAFYENLSPDYDKKDQKVIARDFPTFYCKNVNYTKLTKQVAVISTGIQATIVELKDSSVLKRRPIVDMTVQSLEEEILFKNIHDLLIKTREIVNSNEWNTSGRNIFFRGSKCPEGIKVIREWTTNKGILFNPEDITALEKVALLKKFIAINKLLIKKTDISDNFKPLFRQEKTHLAYKKLSEAYKSLFSFFSKSQLDTLNLIEKYMKNNNHENDLRTVKILRWPNEAKTIFNETPTFDGDQQEKFKGVLASLDSLIPAQQVIPSYYMGL
ncbi:MAG: hypothetical protein REH83_03100 [Rickettsiella sp.]|nr:hypothetical protein [Rickettsiella sp.]